MPREATGELRLAYVHERRALDAIDRLDADTAWREMQAAEAAHVAEAWQGARGRERLEILETYFTEEM